MTGSWLEEPRTCDPQHLLRRIPLHVAIPEKDSFHSRSH